MYTPWVSPYSRGYDPYFTQKINQMVNAARAGMTYNPEAVQQTAQPTQTAQAAQPTEPVVTEEMLEEYRQAIAETDKAYELAKQGMVQDEYGRLVKSDGYVVEDGQDDGKIGFWKSVKNIGKGVGNWFKNLVCDKNGKLSLKQIVKTAAGVAVCTAIACVPGGAALLLAAGVASGTIGMGKNIYKAVTAKTDKEKEQAFQGIGTNGVTLGLSLLAVKGKGNGSIKEGFKSMWSDVSGGAKLLKNNPAAFAAETGNNASKVVFGKKWADVKGECSSFKDYAKMAGDHAVSPLKKYINKDTYLADAEGVIDSKIAKLKQSLEGASESKQAKIMSEINDLKAAKAAYGHQINDAEGLATVKETLSDSIKDAASRVDEYTSQIKKFKAEGKDTEMLQAWLEEANKDLKASQVELNELGRVEAYYKDNPLKMAWHRRDISNQQFKLDNPSAIKRPFIKVGQTISKGYHYTQNHPVRSQVITSTADFNEILTDDASLATYSPEDVTQARQVSQEQLELQKQQLEQEYQALLTQSQSNPQAQTNMNVPTGMPSIIPQGTNVQQGAAQQLMYNWINKYGAV